MVLHVARCVADPSLAMCRSIVWRFHLNYNKQAAHRSHQRPMATNSVMSGAKVYSQRCSDRRRNLPNVSPGCAEHRTSTNHFVLALGHNTDSNYRHQTSGLPTARYEKSLFGHDLARLNGDTKPKLTSPNSSINQDMQDAIRSSTRISRHVRSEGIITSSEERAIGEFKTTAIDHSAISPH